MATTPHSSWNLSVTAGLRSRLPDIGLQGSLIRGFQYSDFPRAQRDRALPDLDSLLNCNAHYRRFDLILLRYGGDLFGVARRDDDARRRLVKGEDSGPQVRVELDLRS